MNGWRKPVLTAGIVGLYLGCLVGGMGLPFLTAWGIGLAVMLAYTALMRPTSEWAATSATLVMTLLVLAGVAALLAGVGGWLTAVLPVPPAWAGPALAIAGTLASRLAWSAKKSEELDEFLDTALSAITEATAGFPEDDLIEQDVPDAATLAAVAEVAAALPDLPEDPTTRRDALEALLRPLTSGHPGALDALTDPGDPLRTEAAAFLALLPGQLSNGFGDGTFSNALEAALLDHGPVLAEAVSRRLLELDLGTSEAWRLLPRAAYLSERAAQAGPGCPSLSELAARMAQFEADDQADG